METVVFRWSSATRLATTSTTRTTRIAVVNRTRRRAPLEDGGGFDSPAANKASRATSFVDFLGAADDAALDDPALELGGLAGPLGPGVRCSSGPAPCGGASV